MDCFVARAPRNDGERKSSARQPSAESRRQSHDLAVEAIEAVMAAGLAGVAFLRAAVQPGHARAATCPFDEGLDAGRQGCAAGIGLMVNHQRYRMPC
jgi:hypothetical protein